MGSTPHHRCLVETAAADPSRDSTPLLSTSSHPPHVGGLAAQNGTLPPGRQLLVSPFGVSTKHELACRGSPVSTPSLHHAPAPAPAASPTQPRQRPPRLASPRLTWPACLPTLAPFVHHTSSYRPYHDPARLGPGAVRSSLDPTTACEQGNWHCTRQHSIARTRDTSRRGGQRTADSYRDRMQHARKQCQNKQHTSMTRSRHIHYHTTTLPAGSHQSAAFPLAAESGSAARLARHSRTAP